MSKKEITKPKYGELYWTFYVRPKDGYTQVLEATWKNDRTDFRRLRDEHIYPNKPAAVAASEKFLESL